MLKLIRPQDARLGMYIVGFEGSWIDHPFWRTHFLLTKASDLARLQASSVAGVTIDESKSVSASEAARAAPVLRGAPSRPDTLSADQLRRAERTVRTCKKAMSRLFGEARMGRTPDPALALSVTREILASLTGSTTALIGLTRIKSTDSYTYLHSIAVSALMLRFGRHLEMDEEDLHQLGMAGLLHDIGKILIPSSVLLKPSGLTDKEMDLIRTHPVEGHRILSGYPNMPDLVLEICLHHHERLDGTGYPHGLTGEELTRPVRLAAICDVYDAVTSVRPYRKAWTPEEALRRLFEWKGHLDQPLLAEFARCLGYEDTIPTELADEPAGPSPARAVNGYSDPRPAGA